MTIEVTMTWEFYIRDVIGAKTLGYSSAQFRISFYVIQDGNSLFSFSNIWHTLCSNDERSVKVLLSRML